MTEITEIPTDKLNYRVILPIFVIILIDLIGLSIILPLMPLYAAAFGADAFMIGLVGASYPMMQFVASPILGQLSDRYGRRPVLIVSQIGTLIGFLILGFANSLVLLFISRIIDGISGGNISTADAAVSDSTTKENRTQGLGLIGAAFGLGFILGPILAIIILGLTDNNYQMVAFAAAVFSLLSILLTVFWFEETLPPEKRGKQTHSRPRGLAVMWTSLRSPATGFLLALMFFQQFAFSGFENFLALFTLNRLGMNASGNAGLFVLAGLIVVVVQGGLVGRWSKRWGNRWLILVGLSTMGIGLVMSACTPRVPVPWYSENAIRAELQNEAKGGVEAGHTQTIQVELPDDSNNGWIGIIWLSLAMIPIATGAGTIFPGINSMLTYRVPEDKLGEILGVSAGYFSLASAISPVVLGLIYKFSGPTLTFALAGAVMTLLWNAARRNSNLTDD